MAIVLFQSLADMSYCGNVERDVQFVQEPPSILMNLPIYQQSVALDLQVTSEAEINKPLHLLFATTVPLKLHHSDVIVVQSWHYFCCARERL